MPSGASVARPEGGYFLKPPRQKQRVPGCSTIAKLIDEPGGLIHWAWEQGTAGLDYRETRDSAASAGTIVHGAAEAWKRGRPFDWTGAPDEAHRGFDAFLEWTRQTRLKIEETEVSLVSETHAYGGTFDAILVGEKRVMCDFKTSSAVYPSHLLQVAAYRQLWLEHHPDQPIDGGFYILRFSRDHGDFAANWYGELDQAWDAFLLCRRLYDLKAALKQRCR
jgi:hypothetical protein